MIFAKQYVPIFSFATSIRPNGFSAADAAKKPFAKTTARVSLTNETALILIVSPYVSFVDGLDDNHPQLLNRTIPGSVSRKQVYLPDVRICRVWMSASSFQ